MLDETVQFVKELMFSGLSRTLQVTLHPLITPYHEECIKEDKLISKDCIDHDMVNYCKNPYRSSKYYDAVKEMSLSLFTQSLS